MVFFVFIRRKCVFNTSSDIKLGVGEVRKHHVKHKCSSSFNAVVNMINMNNLFRNSYHSLNVRMLTFGCLEETNQYLKVLRKPL